MATLPLSDIVNIIVNLSPKSAVRKGFNLCLVMGTSEVITAEERVKLYSSLDSMAEDGLDEKTPEYNAASIIFSQAKSPTRIAVGRHVKADGLTELLVATEQKKDENGEPEEGKYIVTVEREPAEGNKFVYKTAVNAITNPAYNETLPSGYKNLTGEIEATEGHYIMVAEVDSENRAVSAGMAVIGGDNVSLELPGESLLDALRACRDKNRDWYAMTYCGATRDEILTIAQYVETATPSTTYFYTSDDPEALTGGDSIFALLKGLSYQRSIGQYSTTPDAVAGIMGYAMGANTGTSRSAYTLMHKTVTGVLVDDLNDTQVDNLQKVNANYYVNRGAEYDMFENGAMANGAWFDEIINLDMLANNMQLSIMDLFKARPKIPQTEAGMNDIKMAIKPDLAKSRLIGFLAPGKWMGPAIWLTEDFCALETGDMLTDGYLILSEPIDEQSQADRDARKASPIYVPVKLAGATHTAIVQIDVNR